MQYGVPSIEHTPEWQFAPIEMDCRSVSLRSQNSVIRLKVTTKQSRAGRISFLTIEEKVRRPQRNSRFVIVFPSAQTIHFDNDRPI